MEHAHKSYTAKMMRRLEVPNDSLFEINLFRVFPRCGSVFGIF